MKADDTTTLRRPMPASPAYAPPAAIQPIDLRLDANEGAPPPSDWLAAILADCGAETSRYARATALERTLARRHGLDPARVVVTAGADDALERACRSLLAPGRSLVLTTPTFEMVSRYAALAGATLREIPWLEGDFPIEDFCAAIDADSPLVYIASPNNPTGGTIGAADLLAISRKAGSHSLILLDLAYTEFTDGDLEPLASGLPNAIVTRTFSKAWGLAGLRVGWTIAPAAIAAELRRVGQPYAVSTLSLAIATRWLEDGAERVESLVRRTREERTKLASLIRDLGGDALPSSANFVLCRFANAPLVADLLAGCGIGVRRYPAGSPLSSFLRITCPGGSAAFDRLAKALASAVAPQALLLDIDGVLADVSDSYRRAIVETARSFGVTLRAEDVAHAKSLPDSNNDWRTTHRMLRERGVDAGLEAVTARFEAIYNGTSGGPPLWRSERCLLEPSAIDALAARFPLAIVTGRPRRDAERFLRMHGIEGAFRAVVCMEDAPVKPDPAPLHLALETLGTKHAWYVGDTPDDMSAARAAGIVPVACIAPGHDQTSSRSLLLRAGAGAVIASINELPELLP
jgi:histidinol-phosphate aminotransferase